MIDHPREVGGRVQEMVRTLPPGSFAMVMATGIVSVGLHAEHVDLLSRTLLVLAVVGFVVLVLAHAWRLASHRAEFVDDLTRPERGFGFFTFVAAGNVLGVRVADRHFTTALVLLIVSTCFWLVRVYSLPWGLRVDSGPLIGSVNGNWFMWAVGAQSIAVSAAVLAQLRHHELLALIALVAWTIGVFLYFLVGAAVLVRLLARGFTAGDLTPPYWIAMGAAAITSVAGTQVAHLPPGPYGDVARELVRGGAVFAWIIASGLIPLLLATGWWRHVTHRIALHYAADLWSIAFPVGMYAAATQALSNADHLPWLGGAGRAGVDAAFVVWLIIAVMGLGHGVRRIILGGTAPDPRPR